MTRETKQVVLTWLDGLRFEAGAPDGPTALVDGEGREAPGPMQQLLMAAAGCTGVDVVDILRKMRVGLTRCRIEIAGTRREEAPRRYVSLHLVYDLAGEGLDEGKARRAIDLSLEKYCSVMHSLAPDIRVTYDLRLG